MITLKKPYLLFLGAAGSPGYAKTAMGIAHWRRELCCGQLRLPGCAADTGLPDLDLRAARERGAKSLIIGVAPFGGQFDPTWIEVLLEAARLGYDIVSGLHTSLTTVRQLPELAAALDPGPTIQPGVDAPRAGSQAGGPPLHTGKIR